jgi:hypothetical protein
MNAQIFRQLLASKSLVSPSWDFQLGRGGDPSPKTPRGYTLGRASRSVNPGLRRRRTDPNERGK